MGEPAPEKKFMKKAERAACWGARDELWSCLDKVGEKVEECKLFREKYVDMCPASWVVHFDRKYHYEKLKVRLNSDGHQKIDITYGSDGNKSEEQRNTS